MPNITRIRLEYAAACFLAEMRRQFSIRYPDQVNPIQMLEGYSLDDKACLINAIEKAIISSAPDANMSFEQWNKRRQNPNDTAF